MKNIKARLRNNGLVKLAGELYRDVDSDIVRALNRQNENAILGIQKSDATYTILGAEYVYYATGSGESKILHADLLHILVKNAWGMGKKGDFEFVAINEHHSI